MEHKMSDDRSFTVKDIQVALDNYKAQQAAVQNQLGVVTAQIQQLQNTANMIQGAILALESFLAPPPPPAEPPAPPVTPPSET
jgi:hypothetical protein